jgi:hypothetical protein
VEKTSCRPGNTSAVCRNKCPPCWLKRGTYYSCEDEVKGHCRSEAMEIVYI